MRLTLNGKETSLQEQESGKIKEKYHSDFENRVIEIINNWNAGHESFQFKTSGSTGTQSTVVLSRSIMEYSAKCTLNRLDPQGNFQTSLVCINPYYIGGTMAVIRALMGHHDIEFVNPCANPLSVAKGAQYDLVSMVPLQVQTIFEDDANLFDKVNNVIIGGATMNEKVRKRIPSQRNMQFYHSYGMTETASHFALQNLTSEDNYTTLGDVKIKQTSAGCLSVCGTVTDHEWITTTDIVEILDTKRFKWIGRADHVINSGGVKISPEKLERKLDSQIEFPFFIAGIPDEKLGSRAVLIVETTEPLSLNSLDFSGIERYSVPKSCYTLHSFSYTETGKINRNKTLKQLQIES
ncbi:MAG: AMP-binding protein [Cyclobacteriaceae bacterium]